MLAVYDPTPLYDLAETEELAFLQMVIVFIITFLLRFGWIGQRYDREM